jgi:signal transduction histidine kinase
MDNNHVISICISVYDVTQRKNMELEQQKITSDLLQRNRDLEQFAFIVSHNLRAPVANILGLNMLLQENLPEDEKQNILEKISLSTQRLDGVVQDLNTILQVRREVSEIKTQVHFSTLIHNIKESIENILHDSHAVIETDFSQVMSINTIRTYLGSVFFNLITNSVKYAREGVPPHITISTHREGNNIIIRYKDNGRGIDLKKYSEQVFGLYKRFHTQAEGKGIGLFMTKTQVEVMGGKITINSEPNRGTEFTITLPEEED